MFLKRLTLFTVIWTLALIMVGAWVRLHDAGLGCPDWPGCYGHFTPHHAEEYISQAEAENPFGPVTMAKAWKEMVHRYAASLLGLFIIAIAVLFWRVRQQRLAPVWLPPALVGVVIFQGLLGMWTVTLLLKPAIVTAHLIGGMLTLAMLAWLALCLYFPRLPARPGPRGWAWLALIMVSVQIVLGGWTSTNYAALACSDFPACLNGQWLPPMDFSNAFHVLAELGRTHDGDMLPVQALTAIHWLHRLGAVLVLLVVGGLALRLLRDEAWRSWGLVLLASLSLQMLLGISNVVFSLPLSVAVAHTGGAAVLLLVCLALNFRLSRVDSGAGA